MTGEPRSAELHPAIASVIESRRLGDGQGARGTFTVARTRALLQLRALPRPSPWSWTLSLVRAANVLSESPQAVVEREEDGEQLVTRLVFAVPGADFEGFELRELLAAALHSDRGAAFGTKEARQHRLERARALIGRGLNLALAEPRSWVDVLVPMGGRRYMRVEHEDAERDPYEVRPVGAHSPEHSFAVRLVEPRPSVGRRFGEWISGRSDLQAALTELWREAIVGADEENDAADGMSLAPMFPAKPVALGQHARWWSDAGAEAVWLVREGVKLCRLDTALQEAGLDTRALRGWIDCPGLSLTADEGSVSRDGAFDLLVAWLHDLIAHTYELEGEGARRSEVHWPTTLSAVPTASGYTLSLQALEGRVNQQRDLVYVWCHQAGSVPASARARVLQVWPSELAILEGVLPNARFVPLRALGTDPEYDRVDLTSLNQGSLEPLPLEFDAPFETEAGHALVLDVIAYVHRFPAATLGAIVLLAYEREVAHVREQRRVIPGLTLLCRIRPVDDALDLDTLRSDEAIVDGVSRHCRELADAHLESLLAHVGRSTNAWENPLVRAALDRLNAVRLGLRYVVRDGALRLTWDDSVLLELPVGATRSGETRTLRQLLERCRDVGSVIEAPSDSRWATLESDDPRHVPWVISPHARDLLARVVATPVLMRMPVVADAYPVVAPAAEQRRLLLSKETVAADLARSSTDPLARLRLLGHLLVARATGSSTQGLERVALLSRYDPRAAAPARLVSLEAVSLESPPPGLAFPGAVSRELAGPVLEVVPGIASLLHEVLELEPESAPRPDGSLVEGTVPGPVRKRSREPPPLVTHAVVHPLAVGSLKIAGDGSSRGIALWSRGLRIGEIHLPEPLGRVSGRLWLTRNAPHAELEAMTRAEARALFEELVRQRSLLPPSGPRRGKLDAVIEYARGKVADADPLDLAPLLGIGEAAPRTEAALDRSLRAWPLQRLSPKLERWLAEIVIQSIGFRLNLDTAFLSWRVAKVKAVQRDGSVDVDLGRRNPWVQRALEVETSRDALAPFEAAALVVAEFFHQARERGFFEATPADEAVAFWRLLALLVENVDGR